MRLVDDRDLIRPLDDFHRVAAGSEHRPWHAGAEAEATRHVARARDQGLVGLHFLPSLCSHRQFRRATTSTTRCAGTAAPLPRPDVVGPDASEIRLLGTDPHKPEAHEPPEPPDVLCRYPRSLPHDSCLRTVSPLTRHCLP